MQIIIKIEIINVKISSRDGLLYNYFSAIAQLPVVFRYLDTFVANCTILSSNKY